MAGNKNPVTVPFNKGLACISKGSAGLTHRPDGNPNEGGYRFSPARAEPGGINLTRWVTTDL